MSLAHRVDNQEHPKSAGSYGPLLGRSPAMRALFERLAQLALVESIVLVQGETGTGKELVARAIHEASARRNVPMVVIDCAAIPEHDFEDELFGHVRGRKGVGSPRVGAVELARGSVLLLDNVDELRPSNQPKLLRAIETRTVRRLGESNYRNFDVRFMATARRDLQRLVELGVFREDLYFRLAVTSVTVPPLRMRTEDIDLLVAHFWPCTEHEQLSAEVVQELLIKSWSGNVRELRNFVERAVAVGIADALAMVSTTELGPRVPADHGLPASILSMPLPQARERSVEQFDRDYLAALLALHHRDIARVAEHAGVDRTYIHRLLRRYGM